MSETVKVQRELYGNYLAKAEQMLNAMEEAEKRGEWDVCILMAVHASISAADAFCVYNKGERSGSQRHEEAVNLFISCAPNDPQVKSATRHLSRLLGLKNNVAYGERMAKAPEAESAMQDAKRLVSFVKERLMK